jgi:hypothetical protein
MGLSGSILRRAICATFGGLLIFGEPASSDPLPSIVDERMRVEGNTLTFNTDAFRNSETQSSRITYDDDILFGDLIMNFPDVTTVIVSGGGGSSKAAEGIARKIMEFQLDTVAANRCASSCSTIFLAGKKRELAKGGWLCFHRAYVKAADYREVYADGKANGDWEDEFDFIEDVFDFGQISSRDYVEFLLSRGVSIDFIIKSLAYNANDAWCPSREELERYGVINVGATAQE